MNAVTSRELIDVQLNGPRERWRVPAGSHARVTFWWDDVPLGHLLLDREMRPLDQTAVGALAAHACASSVGSWIAGPAFVGQAAAEDRAALSGGLARAGLPEAGAVAERLSAALSPVSVDGDDLAVVVCTRERPKSLALCLRSLLACTVSPGEILVVDNAPGTDDTRAVVAAFDGVRYVVEPRAGLSHARNAGVSSTTRRLIAFTDDDVEVTPSWTARVLQGLQEADALTGQVLPARLESEAQVTFEEALGGFSQGYRPLRFDAEFMRATYKLGMPVWRIGAGANMAFRRDVIDRIGLFDERLGAGASGCSEDSEWWYRLLLAGGTIRYEPRAVVRHHHRQSWEALRGQMRSYMRGHVTALFIQWRQTGHWGNLRRAFQSIPAWQARQLLARVFGGPARPRSTLGAEVRGTFEGYLSGLRSIVRGVRA